LRILPPLLEGAAAMQEKRPDVQFVVVVAPNRDIREAQTIIDKAGLAQTVRLTVIHQQTREALAAADAAAVASGTATLEAALLGTPLVIVYKESSVNWHTLGSLITAEHYGLVNLVAGRRLATELMQDKFTGESLARELFSLLEPRRNAAMRAELQEVAQKIGEPGASHRAALAILDFTGQNRER
jgi:lipid-A-disaccharide synthase